MSFHAAEKIADAVLFEGYMLYPYRPSAIKNRQRWNFGTLYPLEFALSQQPRDPFSFHAEVLFEGGDASTIDLRIRFLQLVPQPGANADSWQVGLVRARTLAGIPLQAIFDPLERDLNFTGLSAEERERAPQYFAECTLMGRMKLLATPIDEKLHRIAITFANETPMTQATSASRAAAARSAAFASAHLVLHSAEGNFVSLLDPPEDVSAAVAECNNRGVYPVIAGVEGDRHTMLCSPIILYDYPQIAPESTGDFFDGTEMDEMLALRVLTLTDEEKREMRASDPHATAILERVEAMVGPQLLAVHGKTRSITPLAEIHKLSTQEIAPTQGAVEPWNPFEEKPALESVRVFGVEVRKGDRVRLWPQKQADILDKVMEGRVAVVEAIEQDLEGNVQFAVVLEDDPGSDMGMLRQPGHRFFYSPEEVEPMNLEAE